MSEPRELPIPFSGSMVRAILADHKFETRRLIKPQPLMKGSAWYWRHPRYDNGMGVNYFHSGYITASLREGMARAAPWQAGDKLWVREMYRLPAFMNPDPITVLADRYGAKGLTDALEYVADGDGKANGRTRAARFMPRWISRLTLHCLGVTAEQLSDITDAAAVAEGIRMVRGIGWGMPDWDDRKLSDSPRGAYFNLFYDINRSAPIEQDPWLWVIKFRRDE